MVSLSDFCWDPGTWSTVVQRGLSVSGPQPWPPRMHIEGSLQQRKSSLRSTVYQKPGHHVIRSDCVDHKNHTASKGTRASGKSSWMLACQRQR